MAMPTDFWRNDQQLNIFRTKPCQRLARDGACGWRSQCQYSHCLEWPRRQPRRHNYSSELCPNICVVEGLEGGTEKIENNCSAGLRCPWAHSKEEVLFHPHIFKTTLCEEHTKNTGGNQSKTRNAKKNRCHRYYCPFAHGTEELRTSPLAEEQRERCLRAMEVFPSDVCCSMCTRHWLAPAAVEQKSQDASAPALGVPMTSLSWPQTPGLQKTPQAQIEQLRGWDGMATNPNLLNNVHGNFGLKPSADFFPRNMMEGLGKPLSPIQTPTLNPYTAPYNHFGEMNHSLFYSEPLSSLRVSTLSDDSPAFIDLKPATKAPQLTPEKTRDLLGEFYYAML